MKDPESKALRLIALAIDDPEADTPHVIESLIRNECADLEDIVAAAPYSEYNNEFAMLNLVREYLDVCRDNMDDDEIESTAAFIQSKTMQLVSPAAEPDDDAFSSTVSAVVKETAALFDSLKGESNERKPL